MKISLRPASLREAEPLTIAPADDPLPWYFDPDAGSIQGPLPMASFCDRSLLVTLAAGQLGLLTLSGEVRTLLQPGQHLLSIGHGPDRVDPAARLTVLDTSRPLAVRWEEATPAPAERPLAPAERPPAPAERPAMATDQSAVPGGSAGITILDPARFHAAFLRNAEECDEPFLKRLIGTLVQAHVGRILAASPAWRQGTASPADAAVLRQRLASLAPADLNAGLEGYGIACTDLTWGTTEPTASRAAPSRTASRATADPATEAAADRPAPDLKTVDTLVPA